MARKIAVIDTFSDRPTGEHLKKCVAELEIRRLLADWVIRGSSIRRRAIRSIPLATLTAKATADYLPAPRTFIPSILPPREVPNCKFVPPLSAQRLNLAQMRAAWDWSAEA